MPERRHSLTPLESELRATEDTIAPAAPGLVTRFQRRFGLLRRQPATLAGAIAHGLVRLGVATGVASGVALLVDHWLGRSPALGFYIVGAALLAVAFGTTTGVGRGVRAEVYYGTDSRARRLNLGIAYVAAGAVVIGIGVAIEALTGR